MQMEHICAHKHTRIVSSHTHTHTHTRISLCSLSLSLSLSHVFRFVSSHASARDCGGFPERVIPRMWALWWDAFEVCMYVCMYELCMFVCGRCGGTHLRFVCMFVCMHVCVSYGGMRACMLLLRYVCMHACMYA